MIAVCPNPYRDTEFRVTRRIMDILKEAGYETALCPVVWEEDEFALPDGLETYVLSEISDSIELAVVIGGDGTILNVARQLYPRAVPSIGINLGTKGFMAALEADEIEKIADAAKGFFVRSERLTVDVSLIRDGETIYKGFALNDAVLNGCGECITITVYCDDDKIMSYGGDGIVVSTPTGSTGYSLSAGGPVVEPDASNIVVSPICAHLISAKSFVLDSEKIITVKADRIHGKRASLTVDGIYCCELQKNDVLKVCASSSTIPMLFPKERSFFDTLFKKLT